VAVELNKVLYVDQDFGTAVAAIQNFLSSEYPDEYNDYIGANLGQALIDIIAYAEQNLLWYLNRKVTDLYFPTARTPNAVSKIARMLGYKPKTATYAQASVTIRLKKGPYTFPVTINRGFKLRGPNRTTWEYRSDVPIVFAPGELVKTLTASQGETITTNFISSGATNQVFELRGISTGKFVAGADFQVFVDGVEWEEYGQVPFSVIEAYETNLVTNPPYLRFGDGVQGKIPPQGAAIEVKYVVCDGFKGRILAGAIKEPISNLVSNFQTIPLEITQTAASAGGDDPEDLRSIVVNSPLFQRTQDRAITKGDYDFLSNQYENVARANASIVRGVSGDLAVQNIYSVFREQIGKLMLNSCETVSGSGEYVSGVAGAVSGYLDILYDHIDLNFTDSCNGNLVQVAVLSKDANRRYVAPLQETLDGLKAHLEERKDATHTLEVLSGTANVVDATITVRVKVSQNAIEDDVVQEISDALEKSDETPFGLLVERPFDQSLYLWNVEQALIDGIEDVNNRVVYIDVEITGPAEFLDDYGNLIIPNGYVIQNGGVTIVKLPRY